MLARSYRLRVAERIRQLVYLTALGALLNAFGPRLLAHPSTPATAEPEIQQPTELPVAAPLIGSDHGKRT
jgi:hypothetical protein